MKDPYVNSNGTLINKLNITNYEELNRAEADICFLKLINVDSVKIDDFSQTLIRKIHKHIFEDIFEWAGEYRTVPIIKEEVVLPGYSIPYSYPRNISNELEVRLNDLDKTPWEKMSIEEISKTFARKIAIIWKIHPFRDGNTRTILSFSYLFAKAHGFAFDIAKFTSGLNRRYNENGKLTSYSIRDKFVLACLDDKDYPEVEPLARVFRMAISEEKNKQK